MIKLFLQYIALFFLLTGTHTAIGQGRTVTRINNGWEFSKDSISSGAPVKWKKIKLPHTWNDKDVVDDEPGYYRGVGWYKRKLSLQPADKNKELFLRFEGANQVAEVYVNGNKAGRHMGGYSAFQFPISRFLNFNGSGGSNEILVKVDNSYDSLIAPLTADFSFFGGLYRDAWLISTNTVHFSMEETGGRGVRIMTPTVDEKEAKLDARLLLTNSSRTLQRVSINCYVKDHQDKIVKARKKSIDIEPSSVEAIVVSVGRIDHPHLWSPEDPYLYTIAIEIKDASGKILDAITEPLGFRWFRFDADSGFYLNGKPLKLVGASRHQDLMDKGNAVPDELAYEDLVLLKKMGGNFLRVAHYPQDPSVMDACDQLGLLASVEIPVVNEISESEIFYRNCDTMLLEMIRQNYNHPSVILWCYMNEVLLRPHFNQDKERQKIYFANITQLAKRLDSICRREDPARYTMIAHHGDFDRYRSTGLTDIPMVVGWNLYSGWYGGTLENFPAFLDKHHQQLPDKPVVVSEYGADADPRIRSLQPVRFDKSIEYAIRFHQYYWQEISKRPFVSGAMIWNLADFNSETREETMPHINNKGMLMWNRQPKDLYYLYQALWAKVPFINISTTYWGVRTGTADSATGLCYQSLQVFSNLDSVELIFNGRSLGWKKQVQGICEWIVPFINKQNSIEAKGLAKGKWYNDRRWINFHLQPYLFNDARIPFVALNILLGANRHFTAEAWQTWQPAQPYRPGSWGYIGGRPFKMKSNTRLPYGSDKAIPGTSIDPVYQTQQVGLSAFRFDVPAGTYELILHFAELEGVNSKTLVYNLSDLARKEQEVQRRFNVYVNEELVLENFDPGAPGLSYPPFKKYTLTTKEGQGIHISFKALEGETVLNAIQLRKIDTNQLIPGLRNRTN